MGIRSFNRAGAFLRKSAPYLLLEILLPGGTLFALMLLIYQQRHLLATEKPQPLHVVAAEAPLWPQPKPALAVCRCTPARAVVGICAAANDNDAALRRAA